MYTVDTPDRRIKLAEDFDLYFAGDEPAGWRIANPERHLEPAPGPADPALATLLCSYFALIAEPGIERMEEEDPGMRRAIEELAARVEPTSPQRRAVHDRLIGLIDFFYG
jgi:hypothetical protein